MTQPTEELLRQADDRLATRAVVPTGRLIVLDNSVVDSTGHYLEYVKRTAKAVETSVTSVVLLANRRFKATEGEGERLSFQVKRAFSATYWDQFKRDKPKSRWKDLQANSLEQFEAFKDSFRYRYYDLLFKRATHMSTPRSPEFAAYTNQDRLKATPPLVLLAAWFFTTRSRGFSIRLNALKVRFQALNHLISRRLPRALSLFLKLFQRASGFLLRLIGLILKIIAAVIFGIIPALLLMPFVALLPKRSLGKEIVQSLNALAIKPDDVVFIPTSGPAELDGIIAWLRGSSRSRNVVLLFRRNLYQSGEELKFALDSIDTRDLKSKLSLLEGLAPNHNIRILTDTQALAEQYALLTIMPVHVLPIPVGDSQVEGEQGEVVVVSVLGDARSEKGFNFLPDVVQNLSNEQDLDYNFLIQSNFSKGNDDDDLRESIFVLGSELQEKVHLSGEPLTSAEYTQWLRKSSIVLIPYAPHLYSARSSGVFAEAIAKGLPCLTSRGSWMHHEIMKSVGGRVECIFEALPDLDLGLNQLFEVKANELLILKVSSKIPLPRSHQYTGTVDLITQLTERLKANGFAEGVTSYQVGMTDVAWVIVHPQLHKKPKFAKSLVEILSSLRLTAKPKACATSLLRNLGCGLVAVDFNSQAIVEGLRTITSDLAAAREDAVNARNSLRLLWDEKAIAQVLIADTLGGRGVL